MHKLLERQLRRQFGDAAAVPKELQAFIDAVDASYAAADSDRLLAERSLELTSQELLAKNEQLRAHQREQQVVFDSVPAMILHKDTQNRILWANREAAKGMGHTQAELAGKRTEEIFPPEVAKALHDDDLVVIRSGQPKLGIVESHPTPAGLMWFRTDKVPYFDENGNVTGVIVLAVDITKQKQQDQALEAAYKDLQRLDRERTQFLNNAAHELGTPLTPIKLQLHLVKSRMERAKDEEQVKSLDILERNFARLSHLVKDLLDSARLQAESLKLLPQDIDLSAAIIASVDNYVDVAGQAEVRLVCDALPTLPVHVDPSRLGQVVDNLLSNAIKFTPPGGTVHVVAKAENGHCMFEVTDNGQGIKAEDLAKLFRPFSQVHDVMQTTRAGTGLGLYICRGIVEASGGSIGVRSDGIGRGSTFWVKLPAIKPARPPSLSTAVAA